MKKYAPVLLIFWIAFFSSVQEARASWLSRSWHAVENVFDSDKVTRTAPNPNPTPVPKPAATTLPPFKSAMTDSGSITPKPDNSFEFDETPSYFVEFDNSKVDKSVPLYLTTTWSYEGAVVSSMTESRAVGKLTGLNNMLGAWVSPTNADWTPGPWDGQPYHWSVQAAWSNQKIEYSNRYSWLGCVGWSISDAFSNTGKLTGGVGLDTQKFTVNPEPFSTVLFLTGGALLGSRLRRRRS